MAPQYVLYVRWSEGYIRFPLSEPAIRVNCLYPFIKRGSLSSVLFIIHSFNLKYYRHSVAQLDQEVRIETVNHALVKVANDETQVVILNPSNYCIVIFQFVGLRCFPSTVINYMAYMRLVCQFTRLARLSSKN